MTKPLVRRIELRIDKMFGVLVKLGLAPKTINQMAVISKFARTIKRLRKARNKR